MTCKMLRFILIFLLFTIILNISAHPLAFPRKKPSIQTIIDSKNVTESTSSISLKVLKKPHHLFIGRCKPEDEILHGENIILNNDGKSQVSATIRMNVEAAVYITCVQILDQISDGEGGYPSFVSGGVGHNYVMFNITTDYGKGFNFYVQINGYPLDKEKAT